MIQQSNQSYNWEEKNQNLSKICEEKYELNLLEIENVYKNFPEAVVHSLHLACNHSFVVQISYRKIQHYSCDEKLLGVLDLKKSIKAMFMANSSTAIIISASPLCQDRNYEIIQWNLKDYSTKIQNYVRNHTYFGYFSIFSKSGLMCGAEVQVNKQFSENINQSLIQQGTLVYFQYLQNFEQTKQEIVNVQKIHTVKFKFTKDQAKQHLKLVKLNDSSLVGWISQEYRSDGRIKIKIYGLDDKSQQKWTDYTFSHEVKFNRQICSLKINEIWEIKPDVFYLKIQEDPEAEKLKKKKMLLEDEEKLKQYEKEHEFIWNYKNTKAQPILFGTDKPHFVQFIDHYSRMYYEIIIKDYIGTARKQRMQNMRQKNSDDYRHYIEDNQYYKWLRQQPKQQDLNIDYIDPQTLQIVVKQTRKFDIRDKYAYKQGKDTKLEIVCFKPELIVEYYEETIKKEVTYKLYIKVRKIKELQYPQNRITAYFLTNYIEGCDEDLVAEVTNILEMNEKDKEIFWG